MEKYLSLKDHVYNYISDEINKGSLSPGDKISEAQIEKALNISKTPVREALIQLSSDGYLDNIPRKGFRVKFLSVEKAKDLYEIIGTLDGRAAALACPFVNENEIAKMQFLVESMDAAISQGLFDKYYQLQVEFHDVYLELCPNVELPPLMQKLKNNFIRKYYFFEDPDNAAKSLHNANVQHAHMIELFKEKDAQGLEEFLRNIHWNKEDAKLDSIGQIGTK